MYRVSELQAGLVRSTARNLRRFKLFWVAPRPPLALLSLASFEGVDVCGLGGLLRLAALDFGGLTLLDCRACGTSAVASHYRLVSIEGFCVWENGPRSTALDVDIATDASS